MDKRGRVISGRKCLLLSITYAFPSFQIDHRLEQLILRLDGLRISLVNPLCRNHIDQLGGKFHVRIFHRARLQYTHAAGTWRADDSSAGSGAFLPGIVAAHFQALRIGEVGQRHLTQRQNLPLE